MPEANAFIWYVPIVVFQHFIFFIPTPVDATGRRIVVPLPLYATALITTCLRSSRLIRAAPEENSYDETLVNKTSLGYSCLGDRARIL